MKISVLGTGAVGRALAGRLDDLGHDVTMATRDPEATAGRDDHAAWAGDHPDVRLVPFAEAGAADVVVNALGGDVTLDVLSGVSLDGALLMDVSNPLDHSHG